MYPGSEVSKFLSRLARGWPTAAVVVTAFGLQAVAATNATHWAFQPLVRPAFPAGKYSNAIDAFVSSALAKKDRALAPEADRRKLIRRLSFDLRGLPPSPEEVSHFLKDTRPGAFERLVQNFLGSPQYGERWGRHWLDIVGYADSNGYFNADSDRPLPGNFATMWCAPSPRTSRSTVLSRNKSRGMNLQVMCLAATSQIGRASCRERV